MAIQSSQDNLYPIVLKGAVIPIGTICYLQTGIYGTPVGLLVSLTSTPRYLKVISTNNGFKGIL